MAAPVRVWVQALRQSRPRCRLRLFRLPRDADDDHRGGRGGGPWARHSRRAPPPRRQGCRQWVPWVRLRRARSPWGFRRWARRYRRRRHRLRWWSRAQALHHLRRIHPGPCHPCGHRDDADDDDGAARPPRSTPRFRRLRWFRFRPVARLPGGCAARFPGGCARAGQVPGARAPGRVPRRGPDPLRPPRRRSCPSPAVRPTRRWRSAGARRRRPADAGGRCGQRVAATCHRRRS